MARNPAPPKPHLAAFAALLDRHMIEGDWKNTAFAAAVTALRSTDVIARDNTVGLWRRGQALPQQIAPILTVLFGTVESPARTELRAAYIAAGRPTYGPTLEKSEPDPVGEIVVPRGEGLAIQRTPPPDDIAAASDPEFVQDLPHVVDQMHRFLTLVQRSGNQLAGGHFSDLPNISQRLFDALHVPGDQLPENIGAIYNLNRLLGGLLDLHHALLNRPEAGSEPLTAALASSLRGVVHSVGLMVRVFPSAQRRDGRLRDTVNPPDLPAARMIAGEARAQDMLPPDDLDALDDIAATTQLPGPQSERAKGGLVGTIRNTLRAAALSLVVGGYANESPGVKAISKFLVSIEEPATVIASGMASDLGGAIRFAVEKAKHNTAVAPDPVPDQFPIPPQHALPDPRLTRFARWRDPILDLPNYLTHEMITLGGPGESFLMGAPYGEEGSTDAERPQRRVAVPFFGLAIDAVTFAQWDAARKAGAELPEPDDEGWGRGDRPVINVSWVDAKAYCAWLNRRLGWTEGYWLDRGLRLAHGYRLPTEAEWEYACRAGETTAFSFGETITTAQANYNGNRFYGPGHYGVYREKTVRVGAHPTNQWGLRQMHGNVWEWVEDAYFDSYADAPLDASQSVPNDISAPRSLRGGSWSKYPQDCRAASRSWEVPGQRFASFGFRVARTPGGLPGLPPSMRGSAGAGLVSNGGMAQLTDASGWPTSPIGLPGGALWNNGGVPRVIPGGVTDSSNSSLFFGSTTAAELLAFKGANLPTSHVNLTTGQFWSNGGVVCIALIDT